MYTDARKNAAAARSGERAVPLTPHDGSTGKALVLGLLLVFASGCAYSSTARQWNGLVDESGAPVFYISTSKVGANLLIAVPFFGDLGIDGLVDDLTEEIKQEGGNNVRIVQGTSENYWYGFPPFTWGVTPVISTVSAEYRPSADAVAEEAAHEAAGHRDTRWYMPWTY